MGAIELPVASEAPPSGLGIGGLDSDPAIQEALLAAIVESSDDAVVSKTLDGRIRSWNAGAMRLFGYTADEIIGRPITVIIPEELRDEEVAFIEKLKRGERIDHFDTIRLTKDGQRIPISLTISPVRDSCGKVIGASKVARDISERTRADELRRRSERELAAEATALGKLNDFSTRLWRCRTLEAGFYEILDSVTDIAGADKGLIEVSIDGAQELGVGAQRGFESSSLEGLRRLTAARDSVVQHSLALGNRVTVQDLEADPAWERTRSAARRAGFRGMIATPLLRADGALLGILWIYFASPYTPSGQELRRLELCGRQASDFVQRCAMERALHEREDALREADRRKDAFLATLAHELRNPLAPIRTAAQVLGMPRVGADVLQRSLGVIQRQVRHMALLLDDLLDVARITQGKLELRCEQVSLTTIVDTAVESAHPLIDAKRHELIVTLAPGVPELYGDPLRLAQVLANLLTNAAKYTDAAGRIELSSQVLGSTLLLSVRDNGIGIPAAALGTIFEMFSQVQGTAARSEGGLGIGLALVKGLVELHGGLVEASSDGPGRGSEFTIRLPLAAASSVAPGKRSPWPGPSTREGGKVLIADDNIDAAEMLAVLLRLSGFEVRVAHSGKAALALAAAYRPDIALLDIGMPDLSGYEVAERLRAEPWGEKLFLIALTGWGQSDDKRHAAAAGFDRHMTKPVDAEALEALMSERAVDESRA